MFCLHALWHCARHLRTDRFSREELEAQQRRRFRRLVRFVHRRSPFYARIMRERGLDPATCRLEDFPDLTKRDLMEHFDELVTDRRITREALAEFCERETDPKARFAGRYYVTHTSGTTGLRGYFVYSAAELACGMSHSMRALPWAPGQKLAWVGKTGGHYPALLMAHSALLMRPLPTYRGLLELDQNESLADGVGRLNAFRPTLLGGYGGFLLRLAREQEAGRLRIRPRAVVVGGDVLTADRRGSLELAFGVPVIDVYACGDLLHVGLDRPAHGGMHLMEDELIVELRQDHYLATSLFQYTQPLIRYRMEDALEVADPLPDGLPFRRVRRILGRMNAPPRFTNEDGDEAEFPVANVEELHLPYVARFQLRQTEIDAFAFRVCLDGALTPEQSDRALARVRDKLSRDLSAHRMRNVRFQVEAVKEIPPDPRTGKFPQVVKDFRA
jgi:phenylacetate-coenzyme A ligase PaaK-like adenylate-forming protein